MLNFSVKVYPQIIWGDKYQANYPALVDDLSKAGISNLIVPAFQGSRIFFSQEVDATPNPWDLRQLRTACQDRQIGFAVEFPVFHDRDAFDKFAELQPRSPSGEVYETAGWYRPVCPSNEGYAQHRLHLIQGALRALQPSLALLNFLWYPYWPVRGGWPKLGSQASTFCFCDNCRHRFTEQTGLQNAAQDVEAWFAFRSNVLADHLADIEELTQALPAPPVLIAELPPVPTPHAAERLRRLTGIHLVAWRRLASVISPQLFYNECGQPLQWAVEVLDELKAFEYSIFPQIDLPPASSFKTEMRAELHAFLKSIEALGIGAIVIHSWNTLHELPELVELFASFSA